MENAEEVMQLLEEFSKIKPKEIPRELEDYLGYVAKTGDPVFQWSLMRNLLREKLLGVITEFYESTLTVELPPCPNVEPFNYERMKTSLLERFDAFSGAPFTIQRICELLINPRKDYNRADKYMRAIEKNILVVSTREPGSGKRPLECDQSETVLNGMPDVKLSESDGSLLHVPTDLPYLGAPPASNDVTIETTEPTSASIVDRVGLGINGDVNSFTSDDKLSNSKESHSTSVTQDSEQAEARLEVNDEVSLNIHGRIVEETDCDSNNRLSNVTERIDPCSDTKLDSIREMSSDTSNLVLPDSIDSTDSKQQQPEPLRSFKLGSDEAVSDENEVSSSPADPPQDILNIQEEITEPTYSEAEATDSCLVHDNETDVNLSPDSDNNSCDRVVVEDETKTISISEVTVTKSDEIDLECNEISGTVNSPDSPENTSQQSDESQDSKVHIELVEEYEEKNSHPDSSNDLCFQNKSISSESQKCEVDLSSEADSVSEENVPVSSKSNDNIIISADQSEVLTVQEITEELLHNKSAEEESSEKNIEKQSLGSPDLPEEAVVSESSSSSLKEDKPSSDTPSDVQSTSDVLVEMYENERRDESVIQSISQIAPDSQEQITIEEISVDPSCEAEEEAMDVDDCSNQMLVSEGENEGEPMDEGDQLQS